MNLYAFGPIAAILDGAYAGIMSIAHFIEPVGGASSAGLAVVVLTLLVRAVLIPVGVSQMRQEATRRRLAPRLAELQRRYRTNPELLQREMMRLYAAEGTSPVAGCLPLLAQAPVLSIVYGLFILDSINGHANALLAGTLFGVPLGAGLATGVAAGTLAWASLWPFLSIMVLIAVVAALSRALVVPPGAGAEPTPGTALPRWLPQLLGFAPFITAFVAALVPLAAALYLLVTVTWTLCERLVLRRVLRR